MQSVIKPFRIPYFLVLIFMTSCSVHQTASHGNCQLTQGQSISKIGNGKHQAKKTLVASTGRDHEPVQNTPSKTDSSTLCKIVGRQIKSFNTH